MPRYSLGIISLIVGCRQPGDADLRLIRQGKRVRLSGEKEGKKGNLD
jgi:hypothetical protein